ncbi:hypothetical protein Aazo_3498 ['Nostoc azollae' 0708]|jgi:hypothetical protein|uniref:Uncharacterized protein n=1 Tax=Nostoc azollae (strain 0708) TaxID=551115 RepID=D7E346_NOSA0|nr:hypothetical protein Aazo_3498 ['Nostoc azollae' 0708]
MVALFMPYCTRDTYSLFGKPGKTAIVNWNSKANNAYFLSGCAISSGEGITNWLITPII